jgi:hypothetical protein
MLERLAAVAAIGLAACGPTDYIAKIYQEDGMLYQVHCRSAYGCSNEEIGAAPAPVVDLSHSPIELQRDMVAHSIDSVKPTIERCGAARAKKEFVAIHVRVTPMGEVDHVIVQQTDDASLAECIALAMRGAKFPRTQRGGAFKYPLVL